MSSDILNNPYERLIPIHRHALYDRGNKENEMKIPYIYQYIFYCASIAAVWAVLDALTGSDTTASATQVLIVGFVMLWAHDKDKAREAD